MPNKFDTGVEEVQQPAATGEETEVQEETMPLVTEEEEPDYAQFADFFKDEESEENAESAETTDSKGPDSPPKTESAEKTEQPPTDQPVYRTQAEFDKAFAKRLKQEREKIRKEYAEHDDLIIEGRARKMMDEYPDDVKSLEFAKHLVKQELTAEKPEAPAEEEPAEDSAQAKVEKWKQAWKDEEPLLGEVLGKKLDPDKPGIVIIEYAKNNAIFDTALRNGATPMQAHALAKALEPYMDKAKAEGQREAVHKIRESNAHATTQAISAKTTGKPMSNAERMKNMSLDQMRAMLLEAQRQGKAGIFIGEE